MGAILSVLAGAVAIDLGAASLPILRIDAVLLSLALAGAVVGMTRARVVLWSAAALVTATLLVVAYTPLTRSLVGGIVRRDALHPADAVVVLAAVVRPDGTANPEAQARLLHAYHLLRTGYAPRLVITRPHPPLPSYLPGVLAQMREFRLDYPVEEVGPIENTHDEALAVARLARERDWQRVLLVTDPTHSRRAAATFEKAGVRVISAPGQEARFDLSSLERPGDRIAAFARWVYEFIGYNLYRRRGWL